MAELITSEAGVAGINVLASPMVRTANPVAVLWERYAVDKPVEVRNRLVEHYMPLVKYLADKVKARLPMSVDVDDLVSAGSTGLMSAVHGFDPARGVKFETYCTARIRGAMLDELRHEDSATRLLRQKTTQLAATRSSLSRDLGRQPNESEMAEALGCTDEEFRALARSTAAASHLSLQATEGDGEDGEGRRSTSLEDTRTEAPWANLAREDVFEFVTRDLQPKERMVIILYYYEGLTMREIGEIFGVTESRVCQIHKRILKDLKKRLQGREGAL